MQSQTIEIYIRTCYNFNLVQLTCFTQSIGVQNLFEFKFELIISCLCNINGKAEFINLNIAIFNFFLVIEIINVRKKAKVVGEMLLL